MKTIYLAGGCFWGTQQFCKLLPGVQSTRVGYANGATAHPSYQQVRYQHTGHAETVRVDYDETLLPTGRLLDYYLLSVDPLSVNRQGEDVGEQYRTGIYYDDPALLPQIRAAVDRKAAALGRPLAVEVCPLAHFYDAEDYHQDYLDKNPGGYCHISPRLLRLAREGRLEELLPG